MNFQLERKSEKRKSEGQAIQVRIYAMKHLDAFVSFARGVHDVLEFGFSILGKKKISFLPNGHHFVVDFWTL